MAFIQKDLIFESSRIYFTEGKETKEVMMDWETPIMQASAEYVTNRGQAESILEIGFGMGISAGYIQEFRPKSHTIIELHPEIIIEAKKWADRKKGVTILEGNWYELVKDGKLGTYDGIFLDTYYDEYVDKFKDYFPNLLNKGGRMTCWNPTGYKETSRELSEKRGITYEKIQLSAKPPKNSYYDSDVYWMPKIQF